MEEDLRAKTTLFITRPVEDAISTPLPRETLEMSYTRSRKSRDFDPRTST